MPAPARSAGSWRISRAAPPPALLGFLLLLAVLMAASFAVGRAAGPVAPGIHRTGNDAPGVPGEPSPGSPSEPDGGGMPGMGGMGSQGPEITAAGR
nr:hypothetical protein [Streptomyces sp. SPB162]